MNLILQPNWAVIRKIYNGILLINSVVLALGVQHSDSVVLLLRVSHSVIWLFATHGLYPLGSSAHGIFQVKILEWIAILFSRASSQHKDRTGVSRVAGRFFTVWSTREAWFIYIYIYIYMCVYVYTYTYIYSFKISFRLLQSIEQSSFCYTVGPWWLSILNIPVCTYQS